MTVGVAGGGAGGDGSGGGGGNGGGRRPLRWAQAGGGGVGAHGRLGAAGVRPKHAMHPIQLPTNIQFAQT